MTEIMTEIITETMTRLQIPESFVSVTGSGCLRLHLPLIYGVEIGVNLKDDRKKTGVQFPESFASFTGSGCLRLHLPAFPGSMTGSVPDR